jgi:hypothetical protein
MQLVRHRTSSSILKTLTNDLLYESKDSRDIEKCSISSLLRVLVEALETFDRWCQRPIFSVGDGYEHLAMVQDRGVIHMTYWEIYPTAINDWLSECWSVKISFRGQMD